MDSDETNDREKVSEQINPALYEFKTYTMLKKDKLLTLPIYTYKNVKRIPIKDKFLQNFPNAVVPDLDTFITACVQRPYNSLLACAEYTTLIPKAIAVLARAATSQVAAKQSQKCLRHQIKKAGFMFEDQPRCLCAA